MHLFRPTSSNISTYTCYSSNLAFEIVYMRQAISKWQSPVVVTNSDIRCFLNCLTGAAPVRAIAQCGCLWLTGRQQPYCRDHQSPIGRSTVTYTVVSRTQSRLVVVKILPLLGSARFNNERFTCSAWISGYARHRNRYACASVICCFNNNNSL